MARANASNSDYKYTVFPAPLRAAFRLQPTTIGEVLNDRISSALNVLRKIPEFSLADLRESSTTNVVEINLEMLKGSLACLQLDVL